ncbi:hypothetical protein SAV14893_084520 [Streptomyces avermitilis]|uniref:Uncharacterized protein n=1 Tax=Streptomyces avermitilis TaxID=33903 RepID=A0A4D4MF50_STRAX|nr:hypothetical protein SAVMC3_00450 [Streptomyces avermitilis]GDY69059.1 hypothetical protein SAV14893_084520 [Streptomyces avermitilis]GDY70560.1 hypothetical protein SAV31267_000450 [Streptomyces avermitilis]
MRNARSSPCVISPTSISPSGLPTGPLPAARGVRSLWPGDGLLPPLSQRTQAARRCRLQQPEQKAAGAQRGAVPGERYSPLDKPGDSLRYGVEVLMKQRHDRRGG